MRTFWITTALLSIGIGGCFTLDKHGNLPNDAGTGEVTDGAFGRRDAGSGGLAGGSPDSDAGWGSDAGTGGSVSPSTTGGRQSPVPDDPPECGPLMARIRDFPEVHADFETYTGQDVFPGIVEATLGSDNKPVYAHEGSTEQTSGPENFDQWYRDVRGANEAFDVEIPIEEVGKGLFVYSNAAFFPIDGRGFGNEGHPHNYHFTTEIHTSFTYRGGEHFTFTGDDDLWLFVNGRLAVDLGGLHEPRSGTVDFDAMAGELGIERDRTYPMDIFHAERHTVQSNFRIQTSIECFVPVSSRSR